MEKLLKLSPIILLSIFVLIISIFTFKGNKADNKFYENKISGKIDKINFSAQYNPIIYIDDESYYLSGYAELHDYIALGDSIFKAENSYKLNYTYTVIA